MSTIMAMGVERIVLVERFELVDQIGEGSLNAVYAGLDHETGRQVAVKLPISASAARGPGRDAIKRRFDREAAALSVIASSHVVELISAGTTAEGSPFLVLERLYGRDLQEIVDDTGPLTPALVARLIDEAATAVELAHGLGIVHRDLKPANLFIHAPPEQRPLVKVLDFGMVFDLEGSLHRTREAFGGTPLYMAPEQVRGQLSRISPATDVWALAMVAIKLLTGEPYWMGGSAQAVMREIQVATPDPPSQRWPWLPPAFDQWFGRATERVPERRFRSVADQARELGRALQGVRAPERSAAIAKLGVAATLETRTPAPSLITGAGSDSTLVGRHAEPGAIEKVLAPGCMVTLTGCLGLGKTRLARLVCENASDDYVDGAWLVNVDAQSTAGVQSGAELIVAAICETLGLQLDTTRPALEQLMAQLAERSLLLVLDGLDVDDDCRALLERLIAALPNTSWLATSHLPLGISAERCVSIEPLPVPAAEPSGLAEAFALAAVELFARRAQEHAPSFAVTEQNVSDVVSICRALAGSPLGIELAAARMSSRTPAAVRRELESLSEPHGPDGAVRAALAWSYGLLEADEQRLLRHLAVLPAGLTLAHVRQLFSDTIIEPSDVAGRLVQSGLLSWSEEGDQRLVMIEAVRDLCSAESTRLGEDEQLWSVAYAHALAIATRDSAVDQEEWLAQVDAERRNLSAVLRYWLSRDVDKAMELAARLSWYWYLRGHYEQGSRWLEQALARSGARDGAVLTRALYGAGRLALLRCQYEHADGLLRRARDLASAAGDLRGEAEAVQLLGSVARERGTYSDAVALHQRGLELWLELGDEREAARARNYLSFAAWLGSRNGDPGDQQRAWWSGRAEQEFRRLGDAEGIVWALLNRGAIHHYAGQDEQARRTLASAFAEAIAIQFNEGIAWALNLIGLGALRRAEYVQARAQLAAALRVHHRLGDLWRCASVLEALAAVSMASGHPAHAAVPIGAARVIREQINVPVPMCERAQLQAIEQAGRDELGIAFDTGIVRGRRTPLSQLVEQASEQP